MTTKEMMLHAVEALPSDATIEDGMERFLFLAKVERGIQQADEDKLIPHSEVRERMAKWLNQLRERQVGRIDSPEGAVT